MWALFGGIGAPGLPWAAFGKIAGEGDLKTLPNIKNTMRRVQGRMGTLEMRRSYNKGRASLVKNIESGFAKQENSISGDRIRREILSAKDRLERKAGKTNSVDSREAVRAKAEFLKNPDMFITRATTACKAKNEEGKNRLLAEVEGARRNKRGYTIKSALAGIAAAVMGVLGVLSSPPIAAMGSGDGSRPFLKMGAFAAAAVLGALMSRAVYKAGYKTALGTIGRIEGALHNRLGDAWGDVMKEIHNVEDKWLKRFGRRS
jgi:hypothetical protein